MKVTFQSMRHLPGTWQGWIKLTVVGTGYDDGGGGGRDGDGEGGSDSNDGDDSNGENSINGSGGSGFGDDSDSGDVRYNMKPIANTTVIVYLKFAERIDLMLDILTAHIHN